MSDPRCGSQAGYDAHRRSGTDICEPCRAAHVRAAQRYRKRRILAHAPLKVDATGTRRRLRALARIGWTGAVLGERLGVSRDAVNKMTRHAQVYRTTAEKVAALYDELSMTPGPSERVRRMAKAKGWPPPLAYDEEDLDDPRARPAIGYALQRQQRAFDEIAVERAMHDASVRLRPAERAEVVRRLTRAGLSAAQIAQRVGVTDRSVVRWRGRAS